MTPVNFEEIDVMLKCFSFEIVIISRYYIHKVKWNGKIPNFEHFKIDVKTYLETISKSKNLKAMKTKQLFDKYKLFL